MNAPRIESHSCVDRIRGALRADPVAMADHLASLDPNADPDPTEPEALRRTLADLLVGGLDPADLSGLSMALGAAYFGSFEADVEIVVEALLAEIE